MEIKSPSTTPSANRRYSYAGRRSSTRLPRKRANSLTASEINHILVQEGTPFFPIEVYESKPCLASIQSRDEINQIENMDEAVVKREVRLDHYQNQEYHDDDSLPSLRSSKSANSPITQNVNRLREEELIHKNEVLMKRVEELENALQFGLKAIETLNDQKKLDQAKLVSYDAERTINQNQLSTYKEEIQNLNAKSEQDRIESVKRFELLQSEARNTENKLAFSRAEIANLRQEIEWLQGKLVQVSLQQKEFVNKARETESTSEIQQTSFQQELKLMQQKIEIQERHHLDVLEKQRIYLETSHSQEKQTLALTISNLERELETLREQAFKIPDCYSRECNSDKPSLYTCYSYTHAKNAPRSVATNTEPVILHTQSACYSYQCDESPKCYSVSCPHKIRQFVLTNPDQLPMNQVDQIVAAKSIAFEMQRCYSYNCNVSSPCYSILCPLNTSQLLVVNPDQQLRDAKKLESLNLNNVTKCYSYSCDGSPNCYSASCPFKQLTLSVVHTEEPVVNITQTVVQKCYSYSCDGSSTCYSSSCPFKRLSLMLVHPEQPQANLRASAASAVVPKCYSFSCDGSSKCYSASCPLKRLTLAVVHADKSTVNTTSGVAQKCYSFGCDGSTHCYSVSCPFKRLTFAVAQTEKPKVSVTPTILPKCYSYSCDGRFDCYSVSCPSKRIKLNLVHPEQSKVTDDIKKASLYRSIQTSKCYSFSCNGLDECYSPSCPTKSHDLVVANSISLPIGSCYSYLCDGTSKSCYSYSHLSDLGLNFKFDELSVVKADLLSKSKQLEACEQRLEYFVDLAANYQKIDCELRDCKLALLQETKRCVEFEHHIDALLKHSKQNEIPLLNSQSQLRELNVKYSELSDKFSSQNMDFESNIAHLRMIQVEFNITRETYEKQINIYNQQLSSTESKLRNSEVKADEFKLLDSQQTHDTQRSHDTLHAKLDERELIHDDRISTLTSELLECHRQIKLFSSEITSLKQENQKLKMLELENFSLAESKAETQKEIESLHKRLEAYKAEIQMLTAETSRLECFQTECERLQNELSYYLKESVSDSKLHEITVQLSESLTSYSSSTIELIQLRTEMKNLLTQESGLLVETELLSIQQSSMNEKLANFENLQSQLNEMINLRKLDQEKIRFLETQLETLQDSEVFTSVKHSQDLSEMTKKIELLEAAMEKLKIVLDTITKQSNDAEQKYKREQKN
ncbi:hypothetical protein BCR33DRAFT_854043 [Rhizoclosmatium globosum]|uniref:Uncharacterized protein n=1 Tax=Rhizoclosmatium globosum TaxID=329046 RepID=A0A1Y2BUD6_9FUNG|nr:hypothetical protein BCR33DRAFT_854043 [Rhizoclosmatium globosum]|eukprot:ORY38380.1 hypothetical protein BCR33DRAFT_854043 [Rhizoclosmatium globosum]